jgi:TolB-like protein/tetratricopeptide (TPR) repeat protein
VSVFNELKRRNVFRVGAAYLASAWLLIQLVNEVSPLLGFSEAVGRSILIAAAIGFLPTLVLAWAFEYTAKGIHRDRGVRQLDSQLPRATRAFDRTVIVVLALALSVFAIDRFLLDPARDSAQIRAATERARTETRLDAYGDKSIAVLAFEDRSQSSSQDPLSLGIAESILYLLGQVPQLRVIAPNSSFAVSERQATVAEISRILHVDYLLGGSVRSDGARIRITASLVDTATETQVWSERFDEESGDVFAIEDQIAAKVLDALKVKLLGATPTVERTDPQLHRIFLQALRVHREGMFAQMPQAQEWLEYVTREDPNYLPAWELLMWTYNALRSDALNRREEQKAGKFAALARRTTDRLETFAPAGYAAISGQRAWMAFNYESPPDLGTAARYFERALANAGAESRLYIGVVPFLLELNRPAEAVKVGEFVLARDPLCLMCYQNLAHAYYRARRYEEVEMVYLSALERELVDIPIRVDYARSLILRGQAAEALRVMDEIKDDSGVGFENDPYVLAMTAMALHDLNRIEEFETIRARLSSNPGVLSSLLAYVGDWEHALDLYFSMPFVARRVFDEPLLGDPFRAHEERWPEIAAKADLAGDPRARIEFTLNLPD